MQNTLNGNQLKFCFGEQNASLNVKVHTYLRQNMAAFEKRMMFVLLTCFECERVEFWINNVTLILFWISYTLKNALSLM